jgi:hypothetical protein
MERAGELISKEIKEHIPKTNKLKYIKQSIRAKQRADDVVKMCVFHIPNILSINCISLNTSNQYCNPHQILCG